MFLIIVYQNISKAIKIEFLKLSGILETNLFATKTTSIFSLLKVNLISIGNRKILFKSF